MATSVRKAQSPLCCQLCDNPNAIKWKCIECALLMCDKCSKDVHRRIKTSEEHTIISIQDIKKEDVRTDSIPGKVISSVVQTYTTNVRAVNKLILTKDESMYLLNNPGKINEGQIVEARLLRASFKVLRKIDITCMDIIITNTDDLVFSTHGECMINLLSDNGSIKPFLDVSPMIPVAKHFNQHGEFIVGLREQGPAFPTTQFSTRKLAIFGTDNKLKLTFEFDKTGTKLFSYIWRITTDSKDNMYAIDHVKYGYGRVIALNRSGDVNFIYAGYSTDKHFKPTDIIVTKRNNILVTCLENSVLHLLNEKGELIAYQSTKDHGIRNPFCLCIDSEGFLLIGCCPKKNEKDNAKIYVMKLIV